MNKMFQIINTTNIEQSIDKKTQNISNTFTHSRNSKAYYKEATNAKLIN